MVATRRIFITLSIAFFVIGAPPAGLEAAKPVPLTPSPAAAVQRIDDYAAAVDAARQAGALLLVSVEPQSGDPHDLAGGHLERADVQRRFAASGTPWIFCRLGLDAGGAAPSSIPASPPCAAAPASSSWITRIPSTPGGSSRSCRARRASTTAFSRRTSTSSRGCRPARSPSGR